MIEIIDKGSPGGWVPSFSANWQGRRKVRAGMLFVPSIGGNHRWTENGGIVLGCEATVNAAEAILRHD